MCESYGGGRSWWWRRLITVVCLVALQALTAVATTDSIGTSMPTEGHEACRKPPQVLRWDHSERRGADSDGITRTPGSNCRASDGVNCDLCCNGKCCEDFSSASAEPIEDQHRIGIRFAVISRSNATFASLMSPTSDGYPSRLSQNIATLNRKFGGKAVLNVWFYLHSAVPWYDSRMVNSLNTDPCYVSVTCDFFTYTMPAVKADSSKVITIVVADEIAYLGESQWPWASVEDSSYQYIEVHAKTIGVNGPGWPTGLGFTLVHEVGHYFGLLHVFERPGFCDVVGDWVSDTPSSKDAATRTQDCNAVVDSCPNLPGTDAINNYMNYARDECMTQFTPGQMERLRQGFRMYRPLLFRSSMIGDGLTCTAADNETSTCACAAGAACAATRTTTAGPTTTTTAPPLTLTTTTAAPPLTLAGTQAPTWVAVSASPTPTPLEAPTTTAAPTTTPPGQSSSSTATVIGAVVGALCLIVMGGLIAVCVRRRRTAARVEYTKTAPPPPSSARASGGGDHASVEMGDAPQQADDSPHHDTHHGSTNETAPLTAPPVKHASLPTADMYVTSPQLSRIGPGAPTNEWSGADTDETSTAPTAAPRSADDGNDVSPPPASATATGGGRTSATAAGRPAAHARCDSLVSAKSDLLYTPRTHDGSPNNLRTDTTDDLGSFRSDGGHTMLPTAVVVMVGTHDRI